MDLGKLQRYLSGETSSSIFGEDFFASEKARIKYPLMKARSEVRLFDVILS